MADFGDFLEGSAAEPVAPEVPENPFVEEAIAAAVLVQENGSATAAVEDVIFSEPATVLDDAGGSAFFTDYTPAAPEPLTPAPPTEPDDNDPRILWGRKNAEILKKKDTEEAESKKKTQSAAKDHLKHFFEARAALLASRKTSNRSAESAVKLEEVPKTGTTWEKVNALITFQGGVHHKDVARFKAVLGTIKGRNVA